MEPKKVQLEEYEWSNIWWDKPEENGKRILLVGDSITNGYRSHVRGKLEEGIYYVDMYATSRAVDNPSFETELFYILGLGHYDYIHFNNGLHGFHMDADTYGACMEAILKRILTEYKETKVVLALSTPVTVAGQSDVLHEENQIVLDRNQKVTELAEKYDLPLEDLYGVVLGNSTIRTNDGYHYLAEGYDLLGKMVAKNIQEYLK